MSACLRVGEYSSDGGDMQFVWDQYEQFKEFVSSRYEFTNTGGSFFLWMPCGDHPANHCAEFSSISSLGSLNTTCSQYSMRAWC